MEMSVGAAAARWRLLEWNLALRYIIVNSLWLKLFRRATNYLLAKIFRSGALRLIWR